MSRPMPRENARAWDSRGAWLPQFARDPGRFCDRICATRLRVVALDQTGHGYSDPPAIANGFGGPDGLTYLRSLPYVDKNNVGLEGHSMGGWTVLAAATAMPDAYKSIVLEGSSTGKPLQPTDAVWPRNLALVFSQYDEFSLIMWGSEYARNVAQSAKLAAVFGVAGPIEPGKVYGDIAQGTARVLYTPAITHPARPFFP